MNFGEKIKILIAIKGLTQEELGHMVGVSRTTVNTWISGRGEPNLNMVISLAKSFPDINADWLLDRSERMDSYNKEFLKMTKDIHTLNYQNSLLEDKISRCSRDYKKINENYNQLLKRFNRYKLLIQTYKNKPNDRDKNKSKLGV